MPHMADAASGSDTLARRIGGGLLLLVALALFYGGGWIVVTNGHGSPLDVEWISHIGGSSSQAWIGPGGVVMALGLVFAMLGVPLILARRHS